MTNLLDKTSSTYIFINPESRPLIVKILATLIMIFGLIRLGIWTFVLGLGSIGLFIYSEGIQIDFANKKFRKVKSFGPQRFGKWENFIDTCYISVFKTALVSGVTGMSGTSVTAKENVVKVNIIFSKSERILAFQTKDKDEAFRVATMLSDRLTMKLWDATEPKGKWFTNAESANESVN
jgi:hypothetical protein